MPPKNSDGKKEKKQPDLPPDPDSGLVWIYACGLRVWVSRETSHVPATVRYLLRRELAGHTMYMLSIIYL